MKIFSTANCSKVGEMRRGVDPACIFSVKFSPDARLLAVTSDKSTLHVFDVPNPAISNTQLSPSDSSERDPSNKWGFLGKIPFMPRAFSDTYSFASAHFECSNGTPTSSSEDNSIPGLPSQRASKGIIGWVNEHTLVVIGSGRDGRWEKFVLVAGDDGKRYCVRDGWKRYLGQ